MITFLHNFHPQPILFSFGVFHIYWYGMFVVLGMISAIAVTLKLASFYDIKKELIIDLSFWVIINSIIGARLYHIFLEFHYYFVHPVDMIKIWQGGLAIHGGIIFGVLTLYFYSKKYKFDLEILLSVIAPGLALAQAIGRWGNYFNQELFGLPTDKPWGIPIDVFNRPEIYLTSKYFHPTFLYESIGNFVIFIVLLIMHYVFMKHKTQKPLIIIGFYLLGYGLLRFSLEFIRIDRTIEIGTWRMPQITSVVLILVFFVYIFIKKYKPQKAIEKNK